MRIGIDLGGTKIEGIVLDESGEEVERLRVATPTDNYQATLNEVTALIKRLEYPFGLADSIGIGMPGSISGLTGRVKNSNSTCLNDRPFREDLEKALARSVFIENDANCFALSEAIDGAAAGESIVFGVILGTGVGGGIVIDQKVINGPNTITGEWGHNPLPWPGEDELPGRHCYCGNSGCIETWLSGRGLVKNYQVIGGARLTAEVVVELAEQGDEFAEVALADYEVRLAKSLSSVINVLDPAVIVLGGGLSKIERLYDQVPTLWSDYIFSDQIKTRLLPARFGDSSGVRGAAWLGN